MDKYSFSAKLRCILLGLTLAFAVSCKNTGSLFKPSTSDSTYADTDQNKLRWEYQRRERQYKKQQRKAARLARTRGNRNVQKVIQTARSYRGTPYRYGGTTRIGMDCSGLLCTSFKAINVNLPRTSQEQSRFGPTVRPKDIQPGDLVFFGESRFSSKISHVGLVTDVKSKEEIYFIHASTSLGVIEDNLFSNYYQKIFLKAVRPKI
jgi:probable lipoprotein NlpC